MGQKINPVSLRLQYTNRRFDSCWYSNYFYKNLITRDIFLQQYLNNFLKLLKLPTGRYSIQHLQKKTQIFNFLCYTKLTREWRSKVFGLTKKNNFLKKSKYFFKTKPELKKKQKKNTKLICFYLTLNQLTIYKLQKKITSFQNPQLWSTAIKNSLPIKKKMNDLSFWNNNDFFLLSKTSKFLNNYLQFPINNYLSNTVKKPNIYLFNNQDQVTSNLLFNNNQEKLILIEKISKQNLINSKINSNNVAFNKQLLIPLDNSKLLFLQNFFIYKTIKSNLKNKITNRSKNMLEKKNQVIGTLLHRNQGFTLARSRFNTFNFKYQNYLESFLSSLYKHEIDLISFRVKNDWQHANYLADEIVYFLEKRIAFRRLKTKLLKDLSKIPEIRGVRITCSGRVGGKSKKAQRAKTECIKYGQTSLQVFSSKIDFSVKTAFTSFGSVGVKVWICYN